MFLPPIDLQAGLQIPGSMHAVLFHSCDNFPHQKNHHH